jgi:hypothetical protein
MANLRDVVTRDLGQGLPARHPVRVFCVGISTGALAGGILARTVEFDLWAFAIPAAIGGATWLADYRRERRAGSRFSD